MSGLGPSFMKIWTCRSSSQSRSWNAWTWIKHVSGASHLSNFWNFFRHDPNDFLSQLVTMDKTWLYHYDPETKQQSMEWRHSGSPCPKKILSAEIGWKSSRLDFLGSRWYPPHWLSSKGPNYQRWVLLISAGANEGHLEGKTPATGRSPRGSSSCTTTPWLTGHLQPPQKMVYLGFQCLDYPPYSPDLAPSDYHLFPGLEKQLKGRHFSSNMEVIAAAETWLDRQPSEFFLSGLQKLEPRAKKCTELHGEYVE